MDREKARPTEEEIRDLLEEEGSLYLLTITVELSRSRGRTGMKQTREVLEEGDFIESNTGRWRPADWDY